MNDVLSILHKPKATATAWPWAVWLKRSLLKNTFRCHIKDAWKNLDDQSLRLSNVTLRSFHNMASRVFGLLIILPWHPARHSTAAWCSTKSPLWLQVKLLLWLREWWGPHRGRERWNKQLFLSFEPLCTWWQKAKGNRRLGMPSAESLVIQGHLQCCLFAWVHCAYKKGGRQKLLN